MEDLLSLGVENGSCELQSHKYRIVRPNRSYHGEIQVEVKFTSMVCKFLLLVSSIHITRSACFEIQNSTKNLISGLTLVVIVKKTIVQLNDHI